MALLTFCAARLDQLLSVLATTSAQRQTGISQMPMPHMVLMHSPLTPDKTTFLQVEMHKFAEFELATSQIIPEVTNPITLVSHCCQ